MSSTVMIICLIIGLILALLISTKTGLNAGVLGLIVSWIVGTIMGGIPLNTLIGYWPTSVMIIALTTTLFFGIARNNGTLKLFANKLVYKARNAVWALPIIIYVVAWIIGAAGAGAIAAEITMSAIGFAIAAQTGMHPLLVMIAVFLGGMGGGGMFWSSEGANRITYYGQVGGVVTDEVVTKTVVSFSIYTVIIYTIIFFIAYIVFKGWKSKVKTIDMEKPEAYNEKQKKTLGLIAVCMFLVIASAIWKCYWPNALSKKLASIFTIQMVCLAGFVVGYFMNLCEDRKTALKVIPWDLILNIGGMCVMIKVLMTFGIPDIIKGWFESGNIPTILVPVIFFVSAGIITLFSNFTVIYPLLMPLVPVVAAATGVNSVTLFTAMALGSGLPGCSPFSTGGACIMSGIPNEDDRQKLVPKLFVTSMIILVITAILIMTPLLHIFPEVIQF